MLPDSHAMIPVITIVTATFNRRDTLERALASAARQGADGVQHVVIDAGSTDGSLDLLAKHRNLDVTSEPDKNLYDGWNKGIARARGEWICILNSDDELEDGAFDAVRRLAIAHPDADMISGPVKITRFGGTPRQQSVIIDDPRMLSLRPQDIGPGVPLTNGRFIKRALIERIGPFDIRYPVISDRQFFLRAMASGARNTVASKALYNYHVHDTSLTFNDAAPSMDQALECLRASIDGLAESRDANLKAAYRSWHCWSAFYASWLNLRQRHFADAAKTMLAGIARDPQLPFKLAPQLIRHLSERSARLGHPVS